MKFVIYCCCFFCLVFLIFKFYICLLFIQKVLEKPNTTVFMGCVGKDEYSEILETKAR